MASVAAIRLSLLGLSSVTHPLLLLLFSQPSHHSEHMNVAKIITITLKTVCTTTYAINLLDLVLEQCCTDQSALFIVLATRTLDVMQ